MSADNFLSHLRKSGRGSLNLDQSVARQTVWSRDASHFQIAPQATLRAGNVADISEILASATATGTPVTFRSGGSSLSGQTVGGGVVVDTRTGFSEIIHVGDNSVTAQPGVTLSRINGHLARAKRRLGPDPASMIASTLGGAVANNSSGMTCGIEFNSYQTIQNATIVFADGSVVDTRSDNADLRFAEAQPGLYQRIVDIRTRIRDDAQAVGHIRRLFSLKNTMGYSLNAFLDFDTPLDIVLHLLVGSEGTLAFLSDIEMGVLTVKPEITTHLLLFDDLEAAGDNLMRVISHQPAAIELMDRQSLRALDDEGQLPDRLASKMGPSSAAVLVEYEASTASELADSSAAFLAEFDHELVYRNVSDSQERATLWGLRKGLYAVVAKGRPVGTTALLEDVAVPPEKITIACTQLSELCERHGYGAPVIFGHVRDGNIHFMIADDFDAAERICAFREFTDDMVEIVLALGGNLKAEHGTGRAMAPFVEAQFGSDLYSLMHDLKAAFDPAGILNPGVILPASATAHMDNLKTTSPVSSVIDACVECGYCESSCPSQGLTLTPRERIVAFRELPTLRGSARKTLEKELVYQADQTCATDGMCQMYCPVGINTGTFVKHIRGQNASAPTHRLAEWAQHHWAMVLTFARVGLRVAAALPRLATVMSTGLSKLFSPGSMPRWNENVPGNGYKRSDLARSPGAEFVLLPSCMNEVFGDPSIAKVVAIAADHGKAVDIPDRIQDFCCGTPFSSKGFTSSYLKQIEANRGVLGDLTHKTAIIDGTSCHQTMAQQISAVIDMTQFIVEHLSTVPIRKKHARIILHPTCSGVPSGANDWMRILAEHIATEVITPIDWSCCGFAGDRGLLVPELTAHATRREAAEVEGTPGIFVANNQPCTIALRSATGAPYTTIIAAWVESVT